MSGYQPSRRAVIVIEDSIAPSVNSLRLACLLLFDLYNKITPHTYYLHFFLLSDPVVLLAVARALITNIQLSQPY